MDTSLSLWETVQDREAWRAAVHGAGHTGSRRLELTGCPVKRFCPPPAAEVSGAILLHFAPGLKGRVLAHSVPQMVAIIVSL